MCRASRIRTCDGDTRTILSASILAALSSSRSRSRSSIFLGWRRLDIFVGVAAAASTTLTTSATEVVPSDSPVTGVVGGSGGGRHSRRSSALLAGISATAAATVSTSATGVVPPDSPGTGIAGGSGCGHLFLAGLCDTASGVSSGADLPRVPYRWWVRGASFGSLDAAAAIALAPSIIGRVRSLASSSPILVAIALPLFRASFAMNCLISVPSCCRRFRYWASDSPWWCGSQ